MAANENEKRYYNAHYPRAGIGNASSFLVSGTPWLTGSATIAAQTTEKVEFPRIAREVVIVNTSDPDLKIYFADQENQSLDNLHCVTLTTNRDSFTFRCKCKEIFIYNLGGDGSAGSTEGSYELYAELTSVAASEMYTLTGSGLTD